MKFATTVDLKHSHQGKKRKPRGDMLINLIMETLSQCVCTSNHHTMHFKSEDLICQLFLKTTGKEKEWLV